MSQTPRAPKRHKIGIDARLFGTAHSTGVGTYTEELIGNILKLDKDNLYTVFTTPESFQYFPFYSTNLRKKAISYPHYSYSEQLFFGKELKASGVELVHYTNFNSPVLYTGTKSIVTIHDLTLWFFPGRMQRSWLKRMGYRYVIRKACQNATKVIAVSEATKQDIVKYLGIPEEKVVVIYEGSPNRIAPVTDPKKIEAIKARHDITRPFFMYVGQWRSHKNVVRLIRAFGLMRHRYGLDYQLVLVGKVDPLAPEVQTTINQLGLQKHVVLTGYIPDNELGAFYSAADAMVYATLYEGFGIPPLEAMSAGTPVIASNLSCLPEVLGNAALYCDPYSIEDMADKMQELAKSYHLKKTLRDAGFKQVKKYSFAKMAKETLELYMEVLGEKPHDRR